ncbi:MAG: sugar kinase [Gammaproteobacteria bacterium]|nr:sugar kinase [Gammaproteobacteria bacterium]
MSNVSRIVIVTKPTRLEELEQQHLTEGAAKFVLESRGQSIEPYRQEDAAYKAALAEVQRQIPNDLSFARVQREDLPSFLFRDKDLIVVCGPDGLFVNLAKYVDDQPVLTVNPDPSTIAGVLMRFSPEEVRDKIAEVQSGRHHIEHLPFVRAMIDNERVIWGINDIFIGRKDHVSARYQMSFGERVEHQSSSGVIVSTGVGSTGWMRSVAAMVSGLTSNRRSNKLSSLPDPTSNELVFVVREPFPSPTTGTSLVTGRVVPGQPLVVSSEMPDGGYIFSDGVIERGLEWNAGSEVVISVGDRYVQRVI